MNRKQFLQNSLILGRATILTSNSLFAASITETNKDKLVDENGIFIQPVLSYSENFSSHRWTMKEAQRFCGRTFTIINWDNVSLRLDTALKLIK